MNHLNFLNFFSGFSFLEGVEVIISILGLGALLRLGSLLVDSVLGSLQGFIPPFRRGRGFDR